MQLFCVFVSLCCVAFAYNLQAIAAAESDSPSNIDSVQNLATVNVHSSDGVKQAKEPLDLLAAENEAVIAENAAAHVHESPRQVRQILVGGFYPGYGGFIGYRKPFYGAYGYGYPYSYGYYPYYNYGGYYPYNAYPRVIYG